MDWEGEAEKVRSERDDWVPDAQRWITQINGVLQCKIDLDPAGEVTGVHVVAGMDREPRHIVRDVESLLKARLGLDVYYKKIGVVQVMNAEAATVGGKSGPAAPGGVTFHPPGRGAPEPLAPPAPEPAYPRTDGPSPGGEGATAPDAAPRPESAPPVPAVLVAEGLAPRILCSAVGIISSDLTVRAEVVLKAGRAEARGVREGPNTAGRDLDMVARATLEALDGLLAEHVNLGLHEVRLDRLGGETVVLAAVDVTEGRRGEVLLGACPTGHNQAQAVVHAVLDALNRRLSLYALKEEGA